MFYILIKNPEHYLPVKEKLLAYQCNIHEVRGVGIDISTANKLYNDISHLPYFQNAVNSVVNKTVVVIYFEHDFMNLEHIKKNIQGSYGTYDQSTIRGYLTVYYNNNVIDSFVHVPDSLSKLEEDLFFLRSL